MAERKILNPWILYFMLRPIKNDVFERNYYKLDYSNELSIKPNEDFYKDGFFDYVVHNKRNFLVQRGMPVSGFSLEEIDKDTNIIAFCKMVKESYLWINEIETGEKVVFTKYITW
jgi:hypothetical protein